MKKLMVVGLALFLVIKVGCGGEESEEEQVCTPQEKTCDGSDVVKCNAEGADWDFFKECDEGCEEGKCTDPSCTPKCDGKSCGNDGCGGPCGSCLNMEGAVDDSLCKADGTCEPACVPDCAGKVCGENGCGGYCGQCNAGFACEAGACVSTCTPSCGTKECGSDGCGGSCGDCPGAAPICQAGKCKAECETNCSGKDCGSDGCGGSCGNCPNGTSCTGGKCVEQADECDGITYEGCCEGSTLKYCEDGELVVADCGGSPKCGWKAESKLYDCGTQGGSDPSGVFKKDCSGDCEPDCTGKECGSNGCGGNCGQCGGSESCSAGACVGDMTCEEYYLCVNGCNESEVCMEDCWEQMNNIAVGQVSLFNKCLTDNCSDTQGDTEWILCMESKCLKEAQDCYGEMCKEHDDCPAGSLCYKSLCSLIYGREFKITIKSGKVATYNPNDNDNPWDALGGMPDPYIEYVVKGQTVAKTKWIDNTLDPVWNHKFTAVLNAGEEVKFIAYDDDISEPDWIGGPNLAAGVSEQKIKASGFTWVPNDDNYGLQKLVVQINPK